MPMEGMFTTAVVASGPGRESLATTALGALHDTGLCERAVLLWGPGVPPMGIETYGGWLTIERCPGGSLRHVLPFVLEQAQAGGFAFWLRDDERVRVNGPVARPITSDLAVLKRRGIWVRIFYGGRAHPEPRFFSGQMRFPEYIRPTLFGISPVDTDGELVAATITIERLRWSSPPGRTRLNLGCGSRTYSLWDNIDHDAECQPDHQLDLGNQPLPYKDNSVEAIYHSHALDHLTFREGQFCLGECRRVLKPGGVLRVVVCDLGKFAEAYTAGTLNQFAYFQPAEFAAAKTQGLKFGMLACGGMSDRKFYSGHKLLMDGPALVECLELAGFAGVHLCAENEYHEQFSDVDDVFPDHSLYVAATRGDHPDLLPNVALSYRVVRLSWGGGVVS